MASNDQIVGAFEWFTSCRIVANPRQAELGPHTPHHGDQMLGGGGVWNVVETQLVFHGSVIGKIMKFDNEIRYVRFTSGLRTPVLNPMSEIHGVVMPAGTPSDGQCKSEARPYYSQRFERLHHAKQVGVLLLAFKLDKILFACVTDWPKRFPQKSKDELSQEHIRLGKELTTRHEERYGFKWNEDHFFPNGHMPLADDSVFARHLAEGWENELSPFTS